MNDDDTHGDAQNLSEEVPAYWMPLDADAETEWLAGEAGDEWEGFDPDYWKANVWVLNAMFEQPGFDVGLTHDDAYRALLAANETLSSSAE